MYNVLIVTCRWTVSTSTPGSCWASWAWRGRETTSTSAPAPLRSLTGPRAPPRRRERSTTLTPSLLLIGQLYSNWPLAAPLSPSSQLHHCLSFRSPKLSEDDLVKKLQPQMPNLPLVYWQEKKKKKVPKNYTGCTKFPDIFDLHFNNKYWQVTETSNGTFYLYGAYLDVRPTNRLVLKFCTSF